MLKVNQLKFGCLLLTILTTSIIGRFILDGTFNTNNIVIHRNDSINPNTAQWPSLSRLPGIGQAKAKAIIQYRDITLKTTSSGQPVFKSADDLLAVKGIGKKTVSDIKPYLKFK